jgi:hypothetical protein
MPYRFTLPKGTNIQTVDNEGNVVFIRLAADACFESGAPFCRVLDATIPCDDEFSQYVVVEKTDGDVDAKPPMCRTVIYVDDKAGIDRIKAAHAEFHAQG